MIKRLLLQKAIIAIVVVTSIFLFSCHNRGIKNVSGKSIDPHLNKVQINWVGHWWKEGDKEKLVREIANEYEFLNQDIKINLKFPEEIYANSAGGDINIVASQIRKEKPDWDILRLYGGFEAIGKELNDNRWADKYLVDFSKVPGFIESHNSFINTPLYQNRFKGMYFGPHNEGQIGALFVNTEVAKKMGITVKQFDMTFDDFLGYMKAAYAYNKTHPEIYPIFEYNWGKTITIFNVLFLSLIDNTEQLFVRRLTVKKLVALEKCFQAFEQLSKYKPIEDNWQERDWGKENARILNDSCLFFCNLTLMYNIWKMKSGDKMSRVMPCEYPVFKKSIAYTGGYLSNWVVLKNSPHCEQAIKLMMYWCTPGVAEKWARYSKSPSGIKGSFTTSTFGVDPYENYSYTIQKKYGGNLIKDEDNEYIVGEKNKNISLRVQDVLEGKLTAKEAFEEFKRLAIY